jgi:RNA polymerase sigma-70 factor (ECF subfamily)
MDGPCSDTDGLLRRAARGDQESWGLLLSRHRERLRRLVACRLDQRLQGRIDPSDVLQEAYLEASAHLPDYLRQPTMPFFLWLCGVVGNKVLELHRCHLGTQRRDAGREVSLQGGALPQTDAAALVARLLGRAPEPSEAAMRAEMKARLLEAVGGMEPLDREVLALRHF